MNRFIVQMPTIASLGLNPAAGTSIQVFQVGADTQVLEPSLTSTHSMHLQEVELKTEPRLKSRPFHTNAGTSITILNTAPFSIINNLTSTAREPLLSKM